MSASFSKIECVGSSTGLDLGSSGAFSGDLSRLQQDQNPPMVVAERKMTAGDVMEVQPILTDKPEWLITHLYVVFTVDFTLDQITTQARLLHFFGPSQLSTSPVVDRDLWTSPCISIPQNTPTRISGNGMLKFEQLNLRPQAQ